MRRLQLVGCAVVGEGEGAVRGTLAAATRRQRRHSLHAIPTLMGAMIQCLWLLWEAAMAGLLMAPLPLVLPPRTPPLPCSHPQPLPSHPPPLGPQPQPSRRHLLLHLPLSHSIFHLYECSPPSAAPAPTRLLLPHAAPSCEEPRGLSRKADPSRSSQKRRAPSSSPDPPPPPAPFIVQCVVNERPALPSSRPSRGRERESKSWDYKQGYFASVSRSRSGGREGERGE